MQRLVVQGLEFSARTGGGLQLKPDCLKAPTEVMPGDKCCLGGLDSAAGAFRATAFTKEKELHRAAGAARKWLPKI